MVNDYDDDDIRYVDPDDVWEDFTWRNPGTDFERSCLKITGRKYFKSEAQAKRLRKIEGHTLGNDPKYPVEYLREIYRWAADKNKRIVAINLDALISAFRNPDNLARFKKGEPAIEDRQGYDDNSIAWD